MPLPGTELGVQLQLLHNII